MSYTQNNNSLSNILIVEDNLPFAENLYITLKNLAYNIVIVNDGRSALNIINKFKPSIILLDLQIPKINGVELLSQIKSNNIKVIILSGQIDYINAITMRNYEIIKSVLVKPITLQHIYDKVKYLLLQDENEKNIVRIKKLLNNFEFNKSAIGYSYILDCIIEIINNPETLKNIEKSLYTKVANKHYLCTSNKIKWNIDKSISSMCRYTNKDILTSSFGNVNKITSKQFLTHIYNIIKREKFI